MKFIDWAKNKLTGYIYPNPEQSYPKLDMEVELDEPVPTASVRFRVTTAELPATVDAPKRVSSVYYVYGQIQEEALRRLPESLRLGAKVEEAGSIQDGVLRLPDDEKKVVIVDERIVPGTLGPTK
jgi:hypothetical protein